ncbi:hypothetical protein [Pedobacter rhizosphaerae]|uniref:Outer membrane protein beta-barrel domain-containing protein n=1 Tax=Pedobacter rhizosphaerae TaxID=390241 RepID=A0A1H9VQI4_9SPHI|nr:hypothetical protein [Pedobacter rhizosphaerae]SES23503.1 hypothetical protein SAMN04488023_14622 [Pedobacter rhizosphaerae]
MRNLGFLLAAVLLPGMGLAQGLTASADGESSVLFKGSSIGVNLGKTEFTFGMNNLQNSIGENRKWVYGASLKGENKEGLSTLFSGGDAVPAASLRGFVGYSFSNAVLPDLEASRRAVDLREEKYNVRFQRRFLSEMRAAAVSACRTQETFQLKQDIISALSKLVFIEEMEAVLAVKAEDKQEVKDAKDAVRKEYDELNKEFKAAIAGYEQERTKLTADRGAKSYWQIIPFALADYGSSKFKKMNRLDSVNYNNSFEDINVRTDRIGFGVNAQYRNFTLGFTYAHIRGNNFDLLTKKEYTYKKVLNSGNQSLTEEKKISAYTGTYGVFDVNEYAVDLVMNFRLDKEAKNHILVNPYMRSQLSTNRELMPNKLNLGTGFYFFQQTGKFLGGFYVELPDVNNNFERMKPEADQYLRPPLQRLSLGIVAKLSISSVLGAF